MFKPQIKLKGTSIMEEMTAENAERNIELANFLIGHSVLNNKGAQMFGKDLFAVYSLMQKRIKALYYHDHHNYTQLYNLQKFEKYKFFINIIEGEVTKAIELNYLPEVEIDPENLE